MKMNKRIDYWSIGLKRFTKKFIDTCFRVFSMQYAITFEDRKNRQYSYLYVKITDELALYGTKVDPRR
jgi:hypothetical protein